LCAVLAAALLLVGCAGQTIAESDELKELSESEKVTLELERSVGFVQDPELLAYIDSVARRIVAEGDRDDVEYRFYVLDTPISNALALPDGQIFVSRGLLVLVNSEDELAGVLAHEIAHLEENHADERENLALVTSPIRIGTGIAGWATGLVIPDLGDAITELGESTTGFFLAPYSREQEREADRVGQALAAAAGYRPEGLADLLDSMAAMEALDAENVLQASWFDTHPATLERVDLSREHAMTLTPVLRSRQARDRAGVLVALQGLVVGDNPGKGFFHENWFVHPERRFVMGFPPDWEFINAGGFVGAAKPDEEILVMLATVARSDDPLDGARAASQKLGIELVSNAELGRVNGLRAARNQARISSADGREEMMELTWIAYEGIVYQVIAAAAPERFDAVSELLRGSANSFRPLTDEERSQIPIVKVRVVESREGESIAELAERVETPWTPELISVVNRKPLTEVLPAGELMKVAVVERFAADEDSVRPRGAFR
jgi:predicted Zn-dependent protease